MNTVKALVHALGVHIAALFVEDDVHVFDMVKFSVVHEVSKVRAIEALLISCILSAVE